MALRFDDHADFHRVTLGATLIGLATGLAAGALPLPTATPAPLVGGLVGLAAGVGLVHGRLGLRLVAAGLAVAAFAALLPVGPWPALVAASALAAFAAASGARAHRPVALGLAAVGVGLAGWAGLRLGFAHELTSWPAALAAGVGASAMAFAGSLAVVPRHLRWQAEPIAAALAALPAGLDPDLRALCDRSVGLWTAARAKLADDDTNTTLLRDGVLRVLDTAARAATGRPAGAADLDQRMADLDQRISTVTDAEARAQYVAARASLEEQRRLHQRLHQGQERVVARLHNHVATLERFQLAVLSLDAAHGAEATQPLLARLGELSTDMAASSEALGELAAGDVSPAAATAGEAASADAGAAPAA
jgi:hypothetical protein